MLVELDKLREIVARFDELTERFCDPGVLSDGKLYKKVATERSELEDLAKASKTYLKAEEDRVAAEQGLGEAEDPDMKDLFRMEIEELKDQQKQLQEEIRLLMLPKDPHSGKNVIVEIRPAAGGDEAGLFASDLFRMYSRYSESKGWKLQVLDSSPTEVGGFKEVVFEIHGHEVFGSLKYESGVHRVQRVPETESGGRIHTSTVTVAVLPEVEDVDEVKVEDKDLRIDTYRASGAGGQHVNKTDSAIRITHLPSGLVVACQDERSQHQNKDKAMRILRAKLLEAEIRRQQEELAANRKSQVGTGDRSEKIRTYNYPQSRVTDHRVGFSVKNLNAVMEGGLEPFVDVLRSQEQQELMELNA